ncbi:class I SAM-dependent methyltransferase [Bradyrhizobium valentinum]|uniref:Ubiquinone biosynthesis protein UbiE n=1 Tax=Bradyrhizobium valentinum TaxID=1518501 RepID=A0A0R3LV21_9BRAD|nr:class I SAM-dependent methyltransferase [Bradyrhizobium valentinum]KRR00554.1 ubiquinone biosynthesis protein UbiE [Bradyrhizobium valentinum]KRR11895.1 ubiquinone biosynthesis protein UbiE [Bradyrhizobium valentinum]
MSITSDARFWDKSSRRYAKSRIADPSGYERTLERTRAYLQPGDSMLELGCGTGTTALRLANGVRSYLATDISGGMIAIAEEKLAVVSIPALSFRTATAEELVHEESRFDAVLGFNYLHLVRNVPDTLRSIHVLLKPGGLFISKTPCLGDMNPLIRLLLLPAMRAIGMAPHVSSLGASALEQLIIDAGFEVLVRESHASKGKDQRPYIVARKR